MHFSMLTKSNVSKIEGTGLGAWFLTWHIIERLQAKLYAVPLDISLQRL